MMKRKKIFLLLLIIIGGFLCIQSVSLAKYASNSVWNYYLKSQGFYFESDDLSDTGKNNVNTLWNGEKVNLSVRNNLNKSLITDFDIEYEMTCEVVGNSSSDLTCLSNGKEKYTGVLSSFQLCVNNDDIDTSSFSKTECELNGYEWKKQVATNNLYFEVVKNNSDYVMDDVIINVYVSSTRPYKKTLSGTYKLQYVENKVGEIIKSYENYGDYNRLTITNTYDEDKNISISFDGTTKIIDIENDYVTNKDSFGNINEITILLKSKQSLSYIVYDQSAELNDDFNIQIK